MRLLLDTHVWLWSLREPERIAPRLHRALADPKNELWLSPISIWEALVLHAKRKISLSGELSEWVADATANLHEAPFTFGIALATHRLVLAHRDPADRFLAATALVLGLTLVTADERLLGLGEIQTLANR